MKRFNLVKEDGATLVDPVSGRRRLVIESVLRLACDGADECESRLAIAARHVAKVDLRGRAVVGNHAAEEIGRDAADEPRRRAKTRHADSDVETGASNNRHRRVASIRGFDRQEIDQGISTTQQHGSSSSYPGSSSEVRRSMRF